MRNKDGKKFESRNKKSSNQSQPKTGFRKKHYKGKDEASNEDNKSFAKKPNQKRNFSSSNQSSGKPRPKKNTSKSTGFEEELRLNKFIASTGLCSRREADEFIILGLITVNEEVITELGAKVNPATDVVKYDGRPLKREKKKYVLLNKPKDFVTTSDDPQGRKTVLDIVRNACDERIYPVGRLDRMTTGVLLLTNDGELTKKLTHPKYNHKKIYHVHLNKGFSKTDMDKLHSGFELEDGFIKVDKANFVNNDDTTQVGVEIHSGKNRIVRRMFQHLGYKVVRLDRVYFAGLTKKGLARGQWRFLEQKELNMLKRGTF